MRYILIGITSTLALCGESFAAAEDPAVFSTDDAARCAAAYAFTLDAMENADVPRNIRNAMRDGLAVWEYELSRSAPNASTNELQAVATRAVAYIRADMPNGQGGEGARARGDFLTNTATDCRDKIVTAYNGSEHPVIPFLRQAEVTVGNPAPVPDSVTTSRPPKVANAKTTAKTAPVVDAPKRGRGLR